MLLLVLLLLFFAGLYNSRFDTSFIKEKWNFVLCACVDANYLRAQACEHGVD